MQTLNVGAGRTDEDYKAAEEQRRVDLLAESKTDANYFFVAAVLSGLGTGLFLFGVRPLVSIGAIDLLDWYGRRLLPMHSLYPLMRYGAAVAWACILVGLGFAAHKGYRWAFLAGVVLYCVDSIALAITISAWSIGVHGFFVFKWFQGQAALRDLKEAQSRE